MGLYGCYKGFVGFIVGFDIECRRTASMLSSACDRLLPNGEVVCKDAPGIRSMRWSRS